MSKLNEPELQLPDLDLIVSQAIPDQIGDSHVQRGIKANQRARLKVAMREYAELYHLERLRDGK